MIFALFVSVEAIASDEDKAKEIEVKFNKIIGDPVEFLQRKWALPSDGCDGSIKVVFKGNELWQELNGEPMFGLPPKPFTVGHKSFRLVFTISDDGKFDKKRIGDSKFVTNVINKDRIEYVWTDIVLASGPKLEIFEGLKKGLTRCQ